MSTNEKQSVVKVAVVGAGLMGRNHLRVYNRLKGAEIIGVVDSDKGKAEEAAREYGCGAFDTIDDLAGRVDAASIACPTALHAEFGLRLLDNGIHCLIEKPLAIDEAECLSLIETAEKKGLVLLAGHIERFNPAVQELSDILRDGQKIHAIDIRRMSAVSADYADVDVVMDLMVHDIDVAISLVGEPPTQVQAETVRTPGTRELSYVTALLTFASGVLVTLTASHITENRIRKLMVTTDMGCISLDYSTQELLVHRQKRSEEVTSRGNYVFDLSIDRVLVRASEPLLLEIENFIDCVKGRAQPLVSGRDALEALRVVWKIQEKIS